MKHEAKILIVDDEPYNDHYGHTAGDACLERVADRDCTRAVEHGQARQEERPPRHSGPEGGGT